MSRPHSKERRGQKERRKKEGVRSCIITKYGVY
jgi:hypothetical protein